MFHFIHKSPLLQIILLLGGVGFLLFRFFCGACEMTISSDMPIYTWNMARWATQHAGLFRATVIVTVLLQLLLLYACYAYNEFAEERTSIMPIVIYVWLLNSLPDPTHISIIFFTNTISLMLLCLSVNLDKTALKGKVLLMGLIIGTGALFNITVLLYIVFSTIVIVIYRISRGKDMIISFIGIVLPAIYLTAIFYISDIKTTMAEVIQNLVIFDITDIFQQISTVKIVLLLALVIALIIHMFTQKVQFDSKVILQRRRLSSVAVFTINTLILFISNGEQFPYNLQYLFVPIAIYLSLACQIKKRISQDILIATTLLIIILLNNLP